jgi:hypothetical protein
MCPANAPRGRLALAAIVRDDADKPTFVVGDDVSRRRTMMGDGLTWKPKAQKVRLLFGGGAYLSGMDHVKGNSDKVFAVIGPFEGHMDKQELQDALELVCRGFNLEPKI